jgi:hypothetical protein
MSGVAERPRRPRVGRRWLAPLVVVAAVLGVVGLSGFVALPGEHAVKEWLGFEYALPGCGDVRDRGEGKAWRTATPLGEARDELRAVRIGDGAYLAGGVADRGALTTVATFERYDLRTGRRTELAPLPEPLNHMGVATHDGDVYVVGGAGEDLDRATNRFWRYDVARDRWTELPPMPTARTALGVAVLDDRLYAVGGKQGRVARGDVEAYSFGSGRWSELTPLPSRADHIQVAAHDGFIYAAGGRNERRGVFADFSRYDPRSDSWTALPPLPGATSGAGLHPFGGRLVVPGGENPPEQYVTGRVVAYDPAARAWTHLPAMEQPRHGFGSVAAGDRLFVFGGSRCAGQAVGVDTVDSLAVPG